MVMTNDERDGLIRQIGDHVAEIRTSVRVNTEIIKRHDVSLYGDGTGADGVVAGVRESRAWMKQIATARASLPTWLQTLISAISLIVAGAALYLSCN